MNRAHAPANSSDSTHLFDRLPGVLFVLGLAARQRAHGHIQSLGRHLLRLQQEGRNRTHEAGVQAAIPRTGELHWRNITATAQQTAARKCRHIVDSVETESNTNLQTEPKTTNHVGLSNHRLAPRARSTAFAHLCRITGAQRQRKAGKILHGSKRPHDRRRAVPCRGTRDGTCAASCDIRQQSPRHSQGFAGIARSTIRSSSRLHGSITG